MKKCLFGVVNLLLVAIVGVLVGVFCKDIFATGVGTASFVTLLVALCIPSLVFFLVKKGETPTIMFLLLMVAELCVSIIFMAKSSLDVKALAITQAIVVGVFLIALLVYFAMDKKEE